MLDCGEWARKRPFFFSVRHATHRERHRLRSHPVSVQHMRFPPKRARTSSTTADTNSGWLIAGIDNLLAFAAGPVRRTLCIGRDDLYRILRIPDERNVHFHPLARVHFDVGDGFARKRCTGLSLRPQTITLLNSLHRRCTEGGGQQGGGVLWIGMKCCFDDDRRHVCPAILPFVFSVRSRSNSKTGIPRYRMNQFFHRTQHALRQLCIDRPTWLHDHTRASHTLRFSGVAV